MPVASADLVDIVRDFLTAHTSLAELSARFGDGVLR